MVLRSPQVSCAFLTPSPSPATAPRPFLNGVMSQVVRVEDPAYKLLDGLRDDALVGFLQPGDQPAPGATAVLLDAAQRSQDTDVFYGDEDSVDDDGRYFAPRLKPDWSPMRQSFTPYVGRAVYFRARYLRAAGATGTAGELFDTASQAMVQPGWRIKHLRRVLLTTQAECPTPPPPIRRATRRSVGTPVVSVIIPTKDRIDLLRPCVDGLLNTTDGAELDLIIIDNGSKESATLAYYEQLKAMTKLRILQFSRSFNYSAMCNMGAEFARSETLLFLNNDIAMIKPDWLTILLDFVGEPTVGAVGPRLLYPTHTLQHAGVVIGMGGLAGHWDPHQPEDYPGYLQRLRGPHEMSCVTGACLSVEKSKFTAVGGFDAENYPVDLNDVDFCLRLQRAGFSNLLVPESVLIHHESASRGQALAPNTKYARERTHFAEHRLGEIRDDPYFHPALSQFSESTKLA